MVSFDVTSLFTNVPVDLTLELLAPHFPPPTLALFHHCLMSSYFLYQGQTFEQTKGLAMGSPLSPAIANFFMEYLEKTALESAPLKPSHWFRYVDDTFVIWPHGSETLPDFLNHLNSIHPDIQFTLEHESEGTLPFLDVLITRHPDGKLTHAVYRKPTHTDRYLHALSNHLLLFFSCLGGWQIIAANCFFSHDDFVLGNFLMRWFSVAFRNLMPLTIYGSSDFGDSPPQGKRVPFFDSATPTNPLRPNTPSNATTTFYSTKHSFTSLWVAWFVVDPRKSMRSSMLLLVMLSLMIVIVSPDKDLFYVIGMSRV
ncbi:UNVERIFIED_CONTAM: hypothetical protein PYX00_001546 [Menopon gallinae]|uniref:Reverse transcriptase domain-containing protein n=1 Tax=Menopon gallinae TaxID=328185 RepID=A0AAW2IEP8_9NEOP